MIFCGGSWLGRAMGRDQIETCKVATPENKIFELARVRSERTARSIGADGTLPLSYTNAHLFGQKADSSCFGSTGGAFQNDQSRRGSIRQSGFKDIADICNLSLVHSKFGQVDWSEAFGPWSCIGGDGCRVCGKLGGSRDFAELLRGRWWANSTSISNVVRDQLPLAQSLGNAGSLRQDSIIGFDIVVDVYFLGGWLVRGWRSRVLG